MAGHSMEVGGGGRFQKLENNLENQGHSKESADAIAASAGRKKYGNEKMNALAHRAHMKASKHLGHAAHHMSKAQEHMGSSPLHQMGGSY